MKLAIITGGSRGLGEALVKQLSESAEWQVVELSRSGRAEGHYDCDLADTAAVAALAAELFPALAKQLWSEVLFINNAGYLQPISAVQRLMPEQIANSIVVNQISPMILMAGFVSAFRTFSGSKTLVNLSSGAALKGYAGWSVYCASKAAAENFIRAMVDEEQHQALPFTAVNYDPGVMDTAMQAEIRQADEADFPAIRRFHDYHADGVLRPAEEVAADLLFKYRQGFSNGIRYSVAD